MTLVAGFELTIAETLHAVPKLKGAVKLVAPGTLPNEGKVMADERRWARGVLIASALPKARTFRAAVRIVRFWAKYGL